MNKTILSKLPTVPQYYTQYVDSKVDLNETPYQPCPFHGEVNGRSFSFSKQMGIWRCFGACHSGGDVVDLHKLNYRLKTKEEALKSLCALYGIELNEKPNFVVERPEVNEAEVYRRRALAIAMSLAKTPEDYIELDYIVSKVPYDVKDLEIFCSSHGYVLPKEMSTGGN